MKNALVVTVAGVIAVLVLAYAMGPTAAAIGLAGVSALLAAFAFMRNRRRLNPPLPGNRRLYAENDLRIENVIPGGVIQVRGIGPDLDDLDLQVTARHLYDQSGFTWFELECEGRDRRLFVTVVDDDFLDITVSGEPLNLKDIGLSEQDFEEQRESPREVTVDEELFEAAETAEATFHRDSDPTSRETYQYWEYENEGRTRLLSVERWPSGFEVHVSQVIAKGDVTVFANRGAA